MSSRSPVPARARALGVTLVNQSSILEYVWLGIRLEMDYKGTARTARFALRLEESKSPTVTDQ